MTQLGKQPTAFGQAAQTYGVQIQQRIIVFASKPSPGFEEAQAQIEAALGKNYDLIRWGVDAFETYLKELQ